MKTSSFKSFFTLAVLLTSFSFQTIAASGNWAQPIKKIKKSGIRVEYLTSDQNQSLTSDKHKESSLVSAKARIMQKGILIAEMPFESIESLSAMIQRAPRIKKGTLTAAIHIKGQTLQSYKITKK